MRYLKKILFYQTSLLCFLFPVCGLIIFILLALLFSTCKRIDNTVPELKFLSGEIKGLDTFILTYNFTDKEGDIEPQLFLEKKIINTRFTSKPTKQTVLLPEIPITPNMEAEIKIILDRILDIGDVTNVYKENDTIIYTAYIRDRAGNQSNLVSSNVLVLIKK